MIQHRVGSFDPFFMTRRTLISTVSIIKIVNECNSRLMVFIEVPGVININSRPFGLSQLIVIYEILPS